MEYLAVRLQILFRGAVELESSALLLSSKTNGYKNRIESVRDDIILLSPNTNLQDIVVVQSSRMLRKLLSIC